MVLKEWLNWIMSISSIKEPGKRDERHINRRLRRIPSDILGLGISLANMMKACDHITRAYP